VPEEIAAVVEMHDDVGAWCVGGGRGENCGMDFHGADGGGVERSTDVQLRKDMCWEAPPNAVVDGSQCVGWAGESARRVNGGQNGMDGGIDSQRW